MMILHARKMKCRPRKAVRLHFNHSSVIRWEIKCGDCYEKWMCNLGGHYDECISSSLMGICMYCRLYFKRLEVSIVYFCCVVYCKSAEKIYEVRINTEKRCIIRTHSKYIFLTYSIICCEYK